MKTLWFVIPAHGRFDMTRACLRQLVRTCEQLAGAGVESSAVVIADDDNLDTAAALGFGTIERCNRPLGRRWNDGYELAGRSGIDWVVPLGTDDWIDADYILAQLFEGSGEMRCCRRTAVVSEDGTRLTRVEINYDGGDGVRMMKTATLKPFGYRPAEEDRARAIDTSILRRVRPASIGYLDLHGLQIVDFKSRGEQLNPYDGFLTDKRLVVEHEEDPWGALANVYPADAIADMQAVYGLVIA